MPATYTDRLDGLTTSIAVKGPCRVATTANITLSGLQTIDGVTVAANDRVLVKDQTDTTENGIWRAQSGAWTRALDFNGTRDVVGGTWVAVNSGTISANTYWKVSGNGIIDVGTDAISFEATSGNLTLQDDLAASTGAGLIGWIQLGVGAVFRWVRDKLRERVSVLDYGATGDGSTDDTAAIQAAITANPGRRIFFPKPSVSYKTTSALTITGNGTVLDLEKGAVIAPNFTTGDIITIGDDATEIESVSIRGGAILPSVTRTSGFAIAAFLATKLRIIGVDLDTIHGYVVRGSVKRHWSGIKLDGFDDVVISGGQSVGAGTAIQMNGRFEVGVPTNQSYGAEFQLQGLIRIYGYALGVHIGGASGGVHLGRADLSLCDTGVQIDMALKQAYNREIWLDQGFQVDVALDYALNVEPDAVGKLACRGAWLNSTSMGAGQGAAGSCNVRFAASSGLAYGLPVVADFIGCDIGNAYGSGMELSQGQVLIANNRIIGNGQGAAGGHGVHLANAAVNATLRDNNFVDNGNVTKGYDVKREVSTTGSSLGNRHTGAGQGAYDQVQTAIFSIRDNEGHNTAVPAGAVPATEWGIDYTQADALITVTAGGTYNLAIGSGLIMLHDDSTGDMGLFICFAGSVTKVSGAATMVSGAAGASQIGLAYAAGPTAYQVSNGYAASHNIYIATIRTRPTS